MERQNIDKIAKNPDDKLLLSKLWDKINTAMQRNIVGFTCYLSPRELELSRFLFGNAEGLHTFGGYPDAERKMLIYLPDYLDTDYLLGEDSPVIALRATFYSGNSPTHRDFLGALMGAGIGRETVGDICISDASCDFFVTPELAPYILQNLTGAGRTKLHLEQIPLDCVCIPQPEFQTIHDTVPSVRLDCVIASGFRISRALSSQHIQSGKVTIDGLPCEKPDRTVSEGCKISLRGHGKILLLSTNGQTKKGRISITIQRYL